MKRRYHVSSGAPKHKSRILRALARELRCENGFAETVWSNPTFDCAFDEDDPRLAVLRDRLRRHRLKWSERRENVYTLAELRRASLLDLSLDRRPVDGGGPEHGTVYDLSSACPHCGTGAVQTSALMVPREELPKTGAISQTCVGHLFVASELAEALRAGAVSGLQLRQVRDCRKGQVLPWWQLIAPYVMPRMSAATKGILRDDSPGWGCRVCERDMYCGTLEEPAQLAYDAREVDADKLPDVVQTWECFGRSVIRDDPERHLIRGFAQPLLLVKPKVLEIFREQKVRKVRFTPVRIVGQT